MHRALKQGRESRVACQCGQDRDEESGRGSTPRPAHTHLLYGRLAGTQRSGPVGTARQKKSKRIDTHLVCTIHLCQYAKLSLPVCPTYWQTPYLSFVCSAVQYNVCFVYQYNITFCTGGTGPETFLASAKNIFSDSRASIILTPD